MKTRFINPAVLTLCLLLTLVGVIRAQGEPSEASELVQLKDYLGSEAVVEGNSEAEQLQNFTVVPGNTKIHETVGYSLNFSVSDSTLLKMVGGGLVFGFPGGFGLSDLDAASINGSFGNLNFEISRIKKVGRFVILEFSTIVVDTLEDPSIKIPKTVDFEILLSDIRNPSIDGQYQISGAAIHDGHVVAGPTLSEPFQITSTDEEAKAKLQIISTNLIAPNSPKVNTSQSFTIETSIINKSNVIAHNVKAKMSSDGASSFDRQLIIDSIGANDTVLAVFTVTAASESGTEHFNTGFATDGIIELSPIDNSATAIIQTPAKLVLNASVNEGDTIFVNAGDSFAVTFTLTNLGEASTGDGHFTLSTDHYKFGGEMTREGEIHVGEPLTFQFVAPAINSTVQFIFNLTTFPIDSNSGMPAEFDSTSDGTVRFAVKVHSETAGGGSHELIVENNPFNPLNGPVAFRYNLDAPSDVDFRIFTITGDEVYAHKYTSGSQGGQAGQNEVEWDGRNSNGEMVLNGVYIVTIEVALTGDKSKLKLAVLK